MFSRPLLHYAHHFDKIWHDRVFKCYARDLSFRMHCIARESHKFHSIIQKLLITQLRIYTYVACIDVYERTVLTCTAIIFEINDLQTIYTNPFPHEGHMKFRISISHKHAARKHIAWKILIFPLVKRKDSAARVSFPCNSLSPYEYL